MDLIIDMLRLRSFWACIFVDDASRAGMLNAEHTPHQLALFPGGCGVACEIPWEPA